MWKFGCLFLTVAAVVSAAEKVPVTVYYESLCPDSIAFVTQQLVPAHNTRLRDYMDLQLVPYGKASHHRSADGQKWEFKCHHGPVECYGNKVHGCVLKQIPNEQNQLKYIDCLMKQAKTTRNEFPLSGCISGTDLSNVTACANGSYPVTNGADILAGYGDETAKLTPPLASVPTVVFNGAFNKSDQDLAQTDFKKVLCSYLENECPAECHSSASIASFSSVLVAILFYMAFRNL
ncbi:hypothetical protein RUM44_002556 [Polyplax serrata]|uniref:Gamma-interferon-inducible lysosomal thiol reductase n=1 Tax=Polyplax serrata TaxID=468196 RepID=A0ABR1AF41_POLSC